MNKSFSITLCKTLNLSDAKAYIKKFFIPLADGNHAVLENGNYVIKNTETIKTAILNRLNKELQTYYFHDLEDVKYITYELNKPLFFEDYINLCPQMKFNYNAEYKITDKIQT